MTLKDPPRQPTAAPHRCSGDWRLAAALCVTLSAILLMEAASKAPVRGQHGMVSSSSPPASQVGVDILKKGGNAVDAAVAMGFALAVTHPTAGNIGGGGFMVIHHGGREASIDYRERAPAGASREMYLDASGQVVKGLSTVGHLASGVPGSVAGMHLAWKQFGRLRWEELLAPAIQLAEQGFEVSYHFSQSLQGKNTREKLEKFPESKRIFLRGGTPYQEGETLRQPELAASLRKIARGGPDAFYRGDIAEQIEAEMKATGGLITRKDLAEYQAVERPVVRGTYRGYEIVSMGPPSSGGIALVEMLNMMERFPVAALGFNSSRVLHLKAEAMRRAFADRAEYLGDSDFTRVPTRGLTSKEYAERVASNILDDVASVSSFLRAGQPPREAPETTHYSVVDADGNAVATTTTLNGGYGSGVTVRGAGFLLNNVMDDFSSKPGVPNMFGLLQGEANSIAPGKRPLSAMTPTIVKKDEKVYLVAGSPGGPRIINTVFQILLNVIDHGMDIQEAVDAPRIHHQWMPDELEAERNGIVRDVELDLLARGHKIVWKERIGDAQCILVDPKTGVRLGAADPRADGRAVGY